MGERTHPAYRHSGLAPALLAHCDAACRSRGASAVVLNADSDDTPKAMYAALGFRSVTLKREYWRHEMSGR